MGKNADRPITRPEKCQQINIDLLVVDEAVQSRCQTDPDTIAAYVEAAHEGATFPDLRVVKTPAGAFIVWDGMHRLAMHRELGNGLVMCRVREGTLDDAIELAAGANSDHGRPRSTADKRRCVLMLLARPQWAKASTAWLADTARVSRAFAERVRSETAGKPKDTIGADGRSRAGTREHVGKAQHVARHVEESAHVGQNGDGQRPNPEPANDLADPDKLEALGNATEPKKLGPPVVEDQYDRPVPAHLAPVFEHRRVIWRLRLDISRLVGELLVALRHESRGGVMIHYGTIESAGRTISDTVGGGLPDAVCPECRAAEPNPDAEACPRCDDRGWLHATAVRSLSPRLKKIVTELQQTGA